jgi:hypothetical protein
MEHVSGISQAAAKGGHGWWNMLAEGLGVDAVVQLEDSFDLKAGIGMMHRPDRAARFCIFQAHE